MVTMRWVSMPIRSGEGRSATGEIMSIAEPCRLLRVREAALVMRLDRETICNRVRSGQVRAWGSPFRVLLDDLLRPHIPKGGKTS